MEEPSKAKRLVKREVIRILTPGTVVEDHLLEERSNNYLVSVSNTAGRWGLAAADCSTGELMVTEFATEDTWGELCDEVSRLQPAELLVPEGEERQAALEAMLAGQGGTVTTWGAEKFLAEDAKEALRRHFGVSSLRGFGCEDMPAAIEAAGALIAYLKRTQKSGLEQIRGLRTYSRDQFMVVDATTRRNLELLASLRDGSRRNTLLWVLDDTVTPMGARLLRRWVTAPLLEKQPIEERLDAVQVFHGDAALRARVRDVLRQIGDLERPVGRAAAGTASGRDLAGLRDSLARLPELRGALAESGERPLESLVADFDPVPDLQDLLARALADSPPASPREGGLIRAGYSKDLDELREARTQGKEWIAGLQERERKRTGIKSLKVGFNQVFGYYIEVTRPNLRPVPEDYQRRQTMANAERFITPELKEYESKVLGAEERILALEQKLFGELRERVAAEAARVQRASETAARADVLSCFAEVASRNGYVRPEIATDDRIDIRAGRHPVVELTLEEERFVPNDAHLDCSENQVLIITGPNMAGKSIYIRQVALIVLMAQMGSFCPAASARIGLADRIFVRAGASDDITQGRSTFLVEMSETAYILRHATPQSLIILDEVGRGTSTYDGVALAWAVGEHLHDVVQARSLFATHYHELTAVAEHRPSVRNYTLAVREQGDEVVFLRRVVPGGADRSYGVHVARLAGLPEKIVERAEKVMAQLVRDERESTELSELYERQPTRAGETRAPYAVEQETETLLLPVDDVALRRVVGELFRLNVANLTPVQALVRLNEWQRQLKDDT